MGLRAGSGRGKDRVGMGSWKGKVNLVMIVERDIDFGWKYDVPCGMRYCLIVDPTSNSRNAKMINCFCNLAPEGMHKPLYLTLR